MSDYDKIVVVTRKTRFQELVERFNTVAQARFYIEYSGHQFADYEYEHECYQRVLEQLRKELDLGLTTLFLERSMVSTYLFGPRDLVVVVGPDGLVANVAKYAGELPILAFNPDPRRNDGVLLPFSPGQAKPALALALQQRLPERRVSMAVAQTGDGQRLTAFNDLFIGARTHVSARYQLHFGDRTEVQSSSGVLVSTGAGSTGWLSSVFSMVSGVSQAFGGRATRKPRLDWDSQQLVFIVREPFVSRGSQAGVVAGIIEPHQPLRLSSLMPSGGVVFSDGIESDFVEFNSGCSLTIALAEHQARLLQPVSRPVACSGVA
ncbi:MAG: NAD+ kinase [Vulcanimicrobiota bacterium]